MKPLLSGRRHLKSTWNGHFYCCQAVFGHLKLNSTNQPAPDTRNAEDCLELSPPNFSIFTLKNVPWRTSLISFTVQDCFLFRFVCIELVSLIWFLQSWVAIYIYGAMINWFTLINKLKQTSVVIASGSILNISTVHLNDIWHLMWRYLFKPVLGRHHVLSGQYSIPRGCLLNTGFTVIFILVPKRLSFGSSLIKCVHVWCSRLSGFYAP